jgi:heterodisulfide reductase subunit B
VTEEFAFFKGCFVPARLPHLEVVSQKVFSELGVSLVNLDDFTCCPEPVGIGINDKMIWLSLAARNLAVAEEHGLDVITICNGCIYTLRHAQRSLNKNKQLREKINEIISDAGHEYRGTVKVSHFLEVLKDEVGTQKLKSAVKRPLSGLTIATHTGCHLLSPKEVMEFDHPLDPTVLDDLVAVLGATPADYDMKTMCCGWTLMAYGSREGAHALLKDKLGNMKLARSDCITVVCPQCFYQFDMGQWITLRRDMHRYDLPVLFYLQLLGLAMGYDLQDIGYDSHKVKNPEFENKIEMKQA